MILMRFFVSLLFLLLLFGGIYFIAQTARQVSSPIISNALREYWRVWIIAPLVNPLRKKLGLLPVTVLPEGEDMARVHQWMEQVRELSQQTRDALQYNTHIPGDRQRELREQLQSLPENLVMLAWKLARLYRLRQALEGSPENLVEVNSMINTVLGEMEHSVRVLQSIPVSLLKLELADGEPVVENLLDDMRETNRRMRDLAEAYRRVNENSV